MSISFTRDPDEWQHECNFYCKDGLHSESAFVDIECVGRGAIIESLQELEPWLKLEVVDFHTAREPVIHGEAFTIPGKDPALDTKPVVMIFRFTCGESS